MNSTIRRALLRIAALALPALAVACLSGHDNPAANIGQIIGPDSNGNGTTGGGSGALAGIYKLSTFNGHTMPDTIIDTSVDVVGDSSRTTIAIMDSAMLQLDTDSLALETDYLQWTDQRSSAFGGPSFTFSTIGSGASDSVYCGPSGYNDTLATQTAFTIAQMTCVAFGFSFFRAATQYTIGGDSLVGTAFYQLFDSAAYATMLPVYQNTVPLVWKFSRSPTDQRGVAPPSAGAARRARRIVITTRTRRN
jgi:hypothetical protein